MAGAPDVCSTGPGVVNAPAPWAPVDLRDGAKTWCVEHFSENAIFAPAARGPKPHLRGPGMYTAPPHRHLLCGVARISRNAPVLSPMKIRFRFSWNSGNPAPSHFSCQFSSVSQFSQFSSDQFSYAMKSGGQGWARVGGNTDAERDGRVARSVGVPGGTPGERIYPSWAKYELSSRV